MTLQQKTDIKAVALQGGAITVREKPLLPFGAFSMIQNMRGKHPAFDKRKGSAQHHTTTLGATAKCLSLYQFSKGKRTERHFLAQMSDDDVYDAANAPPGTGTTFSTAGASIFTGTATSKPASWGNLDDILLFSNGKDQHQLYAGTDNYVKRFIKFDGSAAPSAIPTEGYDYTLDVTDGQTTTYAVLDSLNTLVAFECLFICCPVPAKRLYWTFVTGHENATVRTGTLSYWKSSTNDWADTGESDGTLKTINGGDATLGKNGAMTWTTDTDEVPKMMFGYSGFWYRWETDGALDDEVEVSSLTYGSSFSPLQNVWSGDAPYAIEAHHFDQSATIYKKFAGDTIEIDSMEHEASQSADDKDRLYFATADPIIGVFIDVGEKPNTVTTTTIDGTDGGVKCFTGGETWTTVGTVTDGTSGLGHSGWITWNRPPYSTTYYPQKTQFNKTGYYGYWYYIWLGTATISDDVIISILTMPYFDITNLGAIGYVNAAWKDRAIYNFGDNLGYLSAKLKPMTLNGSDFTVLEAGDGRSNRWVCAKNFHDKLMVWQQELGAEGGCLTLFDTWCPPCSSKVLLSSKIGTLNAKSAIVIDGLTLPRDLDPIGKPTTVAFFISHYGVYFTDGEKPILISHDIQNYFDTKETATCITRGAEDEMFIFHDTSCNVLRLGLVTGPSGTVCNTFPVFDLADWTWSFDAFAQNLSAMCEVEAASGDLAILQYGGGTDDGFIYQLNTGLNDYNAAVKTAITSYIRMEFNGQGEYLELRELLLLTKTQTAGDAELTVYKNDVAVTAVTAKDLSMIAENTNEMMRRHRVPLNVVGQHISVQIQHDEVDEVCYLEALGVNTKTVENQ